MGHNFLSSSKFLLILLLLILPTSFSVVDHDNELGFICLPFTRARNVGFIENRNNAFDAIIAKAPLPVYNGFFYTKKFYKVVSHDHDPAYGLGQCRGDVAHGDCYDCLRNASTAVQKIYDQNCISRGAIIWRSHCMLKYSDVDFRGKLDTIHSHMVYNRTWDGLNLEAAVQQLTTDLRNYASYRKSFYYVTAKEPGTETMLMYGMVQCNRDLSRKDCVECIDVATKYLLINFDIGHVAAIASFGSCTLRYDNVSFF